MSRMQKKRLRMGTEMPPGARKPRRRSGPGSAGSAPRSKPSEGEEGADVRQIGQGADVQKAAPVWLPESRQPRWPRRGAIAGMHLPNQRGNSRSRDMANQTPRLAKLKHQDGRNHPHHGSAKHDSRAPNQGPKSPCCGSAFLRVLTTGAASSTSVCRIRPVSTTADPDVKHGGRRPASPGCRWVHRAADGGTPRLRLRPNRSRCR